MIQKYALLSLLREREGGKEEVEIVRILLDLFVDSLWLVGMFGCAK